MTVWYDVHGEGPPVVLLHAGIADSRMWEPQLQSFSQTHKVVRVDLPGFGRSPYESNVISFRGAVRDALDGAGIERAALVGVSFGGMVALSVALESPERVSALVLVGAGIDDHDWSDEMTALDSAEEEALERGDLDAAAETQVRAWVIGPGRSADAVPGDVRKLVKEMQLNVYKLQEGQEVTSPRLDPPASKRLAEVDVPTLVLTGDEDFDDMKQIGDRLAREIPGAERTTMSAAAHLPSLERPEEFDRIVLGFLGKHGV